jgi:hypothetical protein
MKAPTELTALRNMNTGKECQEETNQHGDQGWGKQAPNVFDQGVYAQVDVPSGAILEE